jgi:HK97 family phage portal protein
MGPDDPIFAKREKRAIQITQNASREELLAFFGVDGGMVRLPSVTVQSALRVPAFSAGVNFLARTLATPTLEAFRETNKGPTKVSGRLQTLVRDAPNPEWSSFAARVFFWTNCFLYGRGLFAILRSNGQPYELWPMNVPAVRVTMDEFGRKSYTVTSSTGQPLPGKRFSSADVIDVPFMLSSNMVNVLSPITVGEKALQLALAMQDYGSNFFAGGGVPPLALKGPIPQGEQALKRRADDVRRAIQAAKDRGEPFFDIPPDHELTPVGVDPEKGQMTDARRLQNEEIARILGVPPVFIQDLSKLTYSNAEQQDLQLVKHTVSHHCSALEQEMNLKLFGQMNGRRYVRHDLDTLLRGDFKTRMEGLARSVQGSIRTPQEARRAEGLPDHDNPLADELFMQGATVVLGTTPAPAAPPQKDDNGDDADAGNKTAD